MDSRDASREGHNEGPKYEEDAVHADCNAAAIVEHGCTPKEGAKYSPQLCRTDNKLRGEFRCIELQPDGGQSS